MTDSHRIPVVGLLAICMVGAWISGLLLKEHAGPWPTEDQTHSLFSRFCGTAVDGESACGVVGRGEWSAIDVTVPTLTRSLSIERSRVVIPVAFMGLAYFLFLGVWFFMTGSCHNWGFWYFIPFLTVVAGAISSLVLIGIMLTKLDVLCTWCFLIHGINAILVAGVLYLRPRRFPHHPFPVTLLPSSAVLKTFALAGLLIGGLWMHRNAKLETRYHVTKLLPYKRFVEQRKKDPAFLLREFMAVEQHDIPVRTVSSPVGFSNGQPELVVFGDFQCPNCRCFTKRWERDYRLKFLSDVRVTYRHFPIDSTCNSEVTDRRHPRACQDSYVAEAARLQGGDEAFAQMYTLLMTKGAGVDEDAYRTLAEGIGLDAERLIDDLVRSDVKDAVSADIGLGVSLGVDSTPAVFLDGRRVPNFCLHNPIFWEAVSEEYLTNPMYTERASVTGSALVAEGGDAP